MRRRTFTESKKFAEQNGLLCEVISADILFIDIDTIEQMKQFDMMIPSLYNIIYMGVSNEPKIFVNRSKSDNFHVRIKLPDFLNIQERIAFQLMLGSDPKKEACSLLGVKLKDNMPILAFEKPGYQSELIQLDIKNRETLVHLDFENRLGKKKGADMLYFLEFGHEPLPLINYI